MWYWMERKGAIPFGVRHLSEAESKRIRFLANSYRFLSIALTILLPFAFLAGLVLGLTLPERLPFIPLVMGGTIGVPAAIVVGARLSWERSRDLYRDGECGIVLQSILDGAIIERLPNSNRIWSINEEIASSHPEFEDSLTSLYIWPDMLPGTVRKMMTAERLEICWVLIQDILFLALIVACMYGCLELIEFLKGCRNSGLLWSMGIFSATMATGFCILQLLVLAVIKICFMVENLRLPLDLFHGRVRQYYNMVSGKTVEILPRSGRPWTLDEEPFLWRRVSRWK